MMVVDFLSSMCTTLNYTSIMPYDCLRVVSAFFRRVLGLKCGDTSCELTSSDCLPPLLEETTSTGPPKYIDIWHTRFRRPTSVLDLV
jgi:hypothetical protein